MKHRLTLDYKLGEGWLAPWVDGLRKGVAMGSICSGSEAVQFPPLRVCPQCRAPSDGWRALPGTATILFRTQGADGDFALVQFDGASNATVVQTDGLSQTCKVAQLAAVPDGPPRLVLQEKA